MTHRYKIIQISGLPLLILIFVSILMLISCEKIGIKFGRGFRYANGGNYIGSNPSMSPDGSKIVFGSPRYGRGDICVINADGSNWVRLTNTSAYEGEPQFSPDGSKIVFISEQDDGNTGQIYLMNADGSNQTSLTHSKYYDSSPSFSPDGKLIVFNRLYGKYNYEILIINVDGSNEKRLTFTDEEEAYPTFTSDSKKIRYTCESKIWEMNIDGTHNTPVMEMNEYGRYVFSPNGLKIACLSSKETDYSIDPYTKTEIFIMNTDGSEIKQLTYTKHYKSGHTFTPDGKRILFLEHERNGRGKGQICIVNIDGTDLRVISNNY